ncbi:universal stress protein [Tindallia californiensis]|uniref:Nucleotide-binding universal stress protein, UspA family n=1 Tax=Tindallia californiensis TaxID=159292 RepID=A0A1H3L4B5_9FIRM|nr:universal stress protein [Tindallia californiensis]SDY59241.1 Nucleotide-binding universal stress protein, UspA family [Tindallia californiensis]
MLVRKVVIAMDFSPASSKLLNCVQELVDNGLEEVVLVHVIDLRIGEDRSIVSIQKETEEKLQAVAEELKKKNITTKISVLGGFAASEIAHIAEKEEASMILIGSIGKSILREIFLGSTTFDLIRMTTTPVLIEKYRKDEDEELQNICISKFQKVVVPVDFSKCSQLVLDEIKEMKSGIDEMILMSVAEHGETREEVERILEDYRKKLEEIAEDFRSLGITVKIKVDVGLPSKLITTTAEQENATLVVMATRGAGLLKSLLLGSTSDAVSRHSKRPVLLIPCGK